MFVSDRLYEIRKELELTQANFASELQVSSRAYASYESGERDLPIQAILILFYKFDVDCTWLLSGLGKKNSADTNTNLTEAIAAVDEFAKVKDITISEDKRQKLAILLLEYFN